MLVDYFYWQYVIAPRWLIEFIWNMQRVIMRAFSVTFMLRTLLAPWHKDTAVWRGGTLDAFGLTIIWNITSRLIGATIRLIVIAAWLVAEAIFAILAVIAVPALLLWPALVLVGIALGLGLFLV